MHILLARNNTCRNPYAARDNMPATIVNADRIVVAADKGIAEQGIRQDLLASSGIYSRLHRA
ncbi:hypothetical protein BBD40_09035 [Paenibacillus ihbetae]|uniref:Uncharacterized protein n=1 Tax=Paenibacillus ihbetae TaxID=1870820 RepID=A0ABX3JWE4_9BACL|nr:hypothetical protein BBD40_09035 [Paenibacillus ihbetae]